MYKKTWIKIIILMLKLIILNFNTNYYDIKTLKNHLIQAWDRAFF